MHTSIVLGKRQKNVKNETKSFYEAITIKWKAMYLFIRQDPC